MCCAVAELKERYAVVFVDLPVYDGSARLVWHKRRFHCADPDCAMGSSTEEDPRIGVPRMAPPRRRAQSGAMRTLGGRGRRRARP